MGFPRLVCRLPVETITRTCSEYWRGTIMAHLDFRHDRVGRPGPSLHTEGEVEVSRGRHRFMEMLERERHSTQRMQELDVESRRIQAMPARMNHAATMAFFSRTESRQRPPARVPSSLGPRRPFATPSLGAQHCVGRKTTQPLIPTRSWSVTVPIPGRDIPG